MDYLLKFNAKENADKINYQNKILLIGSCFTEHIGNFLQEHKFDVLQNPNGILFDTLSVCSALTSYVENKKTDEKDSFFYNELWQHWHFHSQFSHPNKEMHFQQINNSVDNAHLFLKETNFLIITLGSSFAYRLQKNSAGEYANTDFVSNCHKAPLQWFEKYLIPIDEQITHLRNVVQSLQIINPNIKIIFTISPVRHIRDGVVENNRSKARLLEVIHCLVQELDGVYYFPAYEMVIDVLRDYRFYDIDLVHPNYAATQYVVKQFCNACLSTDACNILDEIKPIVVASKHKAFNPDSLAHKKFMMQQYDAIAELLKKYPFLNFENEIAYFGNTVV